MGAEKSYTSKVCTGTNVSTCENTSTSTCAETKATFTDCDAGKKAVKDGVAAATGQTGEIGKCVCATDKTICVIGTISGCDSSTKCFSMMSMVDTPAGGVALEDLKVGDSVRDASGDFTKVLGWLHMLEEETEFVEMKTGAGSVRMTAGHIVDTNLGWRQAQDVKIGMSLVREDGEAAEVTALNIVMEKSAGSPLTQSGTIIVNGFKASVYAEIPAHLHWLANLALFPRRYMWTKAAMWGTMDWYTAGVYNFFSYSPFAFAIGHSA